MADVSRSGGRGGRILIQQATHIVDLGLLGFDDVLRELLDVGVGPIGQHFLGHGDGALMVFDHQLEKHSVELLSGGLDELGHLLVGHHAAGRPVIHDAVFGSSRVGNVIAPLLQPAGHELDLRLLSRPDPSCELNDVRVGAAFLGQPGHVQCLGVVRDHSVCERYVGFIDVNVAHVGLVDTGAR